MMIKKKLMMGSIVSFEDEEKENADFNRVENFEDEGLGNIIFRR